MIYKKFFIRKQKNGTLVVKRRMHFYLDIDAPNEREGRIQARQLVEANTDFNIEFITPLSEQHLAYEKESGAFELTEY